MEARVVTDIQESTKVAPGRPVLSSHEHTTTSATVSMTLFRHFRHAFVGSHRISSTREQKNREGCSIGILYNLYFCIIIHYIISTLKVCILYNLDYVYIYKTLYILKLASIICIISVSMLSI